MPESAEITRAAQPGLMRPRDVAVFLGVSRQRVDQLSTSDVFSRPRMVGIHRMWDQTEIEAWADEQWWDSKPWRRRGSTTGAIRRQS